MNQPHFFFVLADEAKILAVDDDPIMREFAGVYLSSPSTEVETAHGGVSALEALATRPFDLVLLDIDMPGMTGFEVLERLRADPRTQMLPVIVVTGREDIASIDRAYELGATSFISKPVNWRLLAYQIRYVLRASRQAMPPVKAGLAA
jgi:DNA-binding response OmpR family regulator